MKTKLGAFVGKFCWHEEWVIKKVATAMQTAINTYEKEHTQTSEDI
jgi:hypothetical protein